MRWCGWLLVSGCGELVEQIARRRPTTETKVAVGTDVVVAWQRSQRLVEHTSEQMAVGFDAVPSSAAATSLRQVVPPHSTASNRTVLVGCRHHPLGFPPAALSQHVDGSTSNSCVQAFSVFTRILPLLSAAAQQNTYIDVWWNGMRT